MSYSRGRRFFFFLNTQLDICMDIYSLSLHCVSLPPYGHTSDNQSGKRTIHPLLPQPCPRGISYQQPSTASGVQPQSFICVVGTSRYYTVFWFDIRSYLSILTIIRLRALLLPKTSSYVPVLAVIEPGQGPGQKTICRSEFFHGIQPTLLPTL